MADISMCMGKNCKRKNTCYRYKAPRSHHQSMMAFDSDPENCTDFIEMKAKSQTYHWHKSSTTLPHGSNNRSPTDNDDK